LDYYLIRIAGQKSSLGEIMVLYGCSGSNVTLKMSQVRTWKGLRDPKCGVSLSLSALFRQVVGTSIESSNSRSGED